MFRNTIHRLTLPDLKQLIEFDEDCFSSVSSTPTPLGSSLPSPTSLFDLNETDPSSQAISQAHQSSLSKIIGGHSNANANANSKYTNGNLNGSQNQAPGLLEIPNHPRGSGAKSILSASSDRGRSKSVVLNPLGAGDTCAGVFMMEFLRHKVCVLSPIFFDFFSLYYVFFFFSFPFLFFAFCMF